MITAATLDVTQLPPKLKHPTIFQHFDALEAGEGFVIENDHDPKPLYYELLGERGNIFTWNYLEKGPEWWKVEINKRSKDENEETVGEIVARDIRKAEILKAKGIDFCCGGNRTIKEVSEEAGLDENALKAELEAVSKTPVAPSQDFNKWELDFLTDYIVNTHHRYIRESVDTIYGLAVKVADVHGENHPELKKLAQGTQHLFQDLLSHLQKEETVLFPAIKEAVAKKRDPNATTTMPEGFIKGPIQMMEKEHLIAGEDLTYFRKITNNFSLPDDACNSYTYLFEKMKEFENDLHQHIHLENNILFPKAIALES